MSDSTDIELLHRVWVAMSGAGNLGVLEGALDPDAQWLGVEDGQICENRKTILTVMKRNLKAGFAGRIEETIEIGGRIVPSRSPPRRRTAVGSRHRLRRRHNARRARDRAEGLHRPSRRHDLRADRHDWPQAPNDVAKHMTAGTSCADCATRPRTSASGI
jgi:hypothetical protein